MQWRRRSATGGLVVGPSGGRGRHGADGGGGVLRRLRGRAIFLFRILRLLLRRRLCLLLVMEGREV